MSGPEAHAAKLTELREKIFDLQGEGPPYSVSVMAWLVCKDGLVEALDHALTLYAAFGEKPAGYAHCGRCEGTCLKPRDHEGSS